MKSKNENVNKGGKINKRDINVKGGKKTNILSARKGCDNFIFQFWNGSKVIASEQLQKLQCKIDVQINLMKRWISNNELININGC